MAQAKVIRALAEKALLPFALPCSMALAPVGPPAATMRRCIDAGMAGEQTRTASDARRSALMAAAQAGDAVAYTTLLRDCVPFIAGLARRHGVAPDRADDVVQEVLLTVHRARATYDPRRSFEAWLRVTAERRAVDCLRRTHRHGRREVHAPAAYASHADETVDLAAGLHRREDAERIGAALAQLPRRQREAVRHLVLEERSLGDTAVLTGRSKGSLKVNLHRALNALRLKINRGD
jgi:RNA polymerase sigma factor (sigma-70 family)